jgi:hypothetical protein
MVLGEGFEPPKAEPPDLQSGAFVHFANLAYGADGGNRTHDLVITNDLLCH